MLWRGYNTQKKTAREAKRGQEETKDLGNVELGKEVFLSVLRSSEEEDRWKGGSQ